MLKQNPDAAPEMRLKPLLWREYAQQSRRESPKSNADQVSRAARSYWSFRFRVDQLGPAIERALDRADDLLRACRHRKRESRNLADLLLVQRC